MATYNLVNSVKGGCGKTTFSIWLAYHLNNSLLIDMDLLGTSMQIRFIGNTDPGQTSFTNDVFKGVKKSTKDFVNRIELKTGKYMNVIFASMDSSEKGNFKSGRHSGYTPAVKHSIFRMGIRELIKDNKVVGGEKIEHFIFDMPPNSDGFSDAAMECIFNPRYSDLKGGDRKNLFIIVGMEWGQTIATINELKSLLLHNDEREPDRIFLVLNQNLCGDFGDTHYENRKQKIEREMEEWGLDESITRKIFFLKVKNNEYYAKLGIDGIGLRKDEIGASDKRLSEEEAKKFFNAFLLRTIVPAVAEYGKEFKNILRVPGKDEAEKLENLISGKRDEKSERE